MDYLGSAASDLVTGSGLAALTAASDAGVVLAAVGGAIGVALAYFEVFKRQLPLAPALLRLVLSATQFFYLWEAKDPDVGAGLVAVPLFFIVACGQRGSASEYLQRARVLSAALSAATLAAAGIYYGSPPASPASAAEAIRGGQAAEAIYYGGAAQAAGDLFAGFRKFLPVTDVAFAVASSDRWLPAAVRGAVFALLAAFPGLPRSLLRGPTPDWLLMLYGASLVQSTMVQACSLRIELAALDDPQRALMLLSACALATGFVQRQADPVYISLATLAVLAACAVSRAAHMKWVLRED
jgi:hypothetical protein